MPLGTLDSLDVEELVPRAASDRLVFAHFMVGIVAGRTSAADYDDDMKRAKALGIDAFALNVGTDSYTEAQLNLAYQSAANNGMKVFISFDFNWFNSYSSAAAVGQWINKYKDKPAQLKIGSRVFASSFVGDGLDVGTVKSNAGADVFWAPNYHPHKTDASALGNVDAAFNWMAWPSNGQNKAPTPGALLTVHEGDTLYKNWLGSKPYIAPVSPWFSTHYGPEVSYSKNWIFPAELQWYNRWNEILTLGPQYIEIITWNDYGESHYIGPLSSPHGDDGNSKWVNDMPHDGWLDMAKPFIAAFKAGATTVNNYITDDQLVYWYRPTPKNINCDATDTTMADANNPNGDYFKGRPNGYDTVEDVVFVVSLLKTAGQVTVISGDKSPVTYDAPAGAYAKKIPMGVGKQAFYISRGGSTVVSGTSLRDVSNTCPCGIYNFNAYVGVLPFQPFKGLGSGSYGGFTTNLKVACSPTPTLNGLVAGPTPTYNPNTGSATTTSSSSSSSSSTRSTTSTRSSSSTSTMKPTTTTTSSSSSTSKPTSSRSSTSKPTSTSTSTIKLLSTTISTSTTKPPTTSSSSTSKPATTTTSAANGCNSGTVADGESGNYTGLCQFSCALGYCPPGPCKCFSTGPPAWNQAVVAAGGCPAPGLGDGYRGLCSFTCGRGYCPAGACQPNC
ncbi:glycosyl hydrolase family 71-domain-containing protein [Lasiosphaeris hirsuta]|uniref:Glycosyl hydrolase family 71-domain-containing protein n=1 Tax=Lasiosphaeris hirsuta TaxID=260670 RepID=A0AA40DNT5_9PEZI|nr:glycosyl hydrolase family 71-domain-containing protein [Lasiosphaeris hirsuta]